MNIKSLWSCDLTPKHNLNRKMQGPSSFILTRHEFIYTWQLAGLEFNLPTLISQTNFPSSTNFFVDVFKIRFNFFFFKQGTVQDGLQNAINLIIFPSQKLEFDPFFKTKKIFVNGKHLGRVSSVRLTNLFGDFTNRRWKSVFCDYEKINCLSVRLFHEWKNIWQL